VKAVPALLPPVASPVPAFDPPTAETLLFAAPHRVLRQSGSGCGGRATFLGGRGGVCWVKF